MFYSCYLRNNVYYKEREKYDNKPHKLIIRSPLVRNELVRKELSKLAAKYGWHALVSELYLIIHDANEAKKKKEGRPKTTSTDKIMHVWIAVEIERYLRKKKFVDATVKEIFQELKMHGKPWLVFVGERDEKEIKKAQTARRSHAWGQALMKKDPKLAKWWSHNLDLAKKIIDEKWSVTIKRGGPKPAR